MVDISGRTTVCGIIGDPIEHTMSPAMQNAAFTHLKLDYVYIPFLVKKEVLNDAVMAMRALHIRGLNVTIPHKVAVMPLLDQVDELAAKIGAVNTIVNDNGILKGYNTDAQGFTRVLLEKGIGPEGKNVLVLGAGGAARSIAFALAERGARLSIFNRHETSARELATALSGNCDAVSVDFSQLQGVLRQADILVNTTSVGMSPDFDGTPVAGDILRPGLVVYDIVYNPVETRLLREASKAGAQTIGGLDMLVQQGAAAFALWTGCRAPVDIMKEAAQKQLNG